jgi:hypothetical protein
MLLPYLAACLLCFAPTPPPPEAVAWAQEQDPTEKALAIQGLADRLARSVAGRDPAARHLWTALSEMDPAHALLPETLKVLPTLPFFSGSRIPTDRVVDQTLMGHLSLPTAKGLRVLFEDQSELQIELDSSGVLASTETKDGKAITSWSDTVVGIKWSATKPELFRLGAVRKALGVRPPMNLYQDRPVYWLPDDHVAFGREIWHCRSRKWCIDYEHGRSDWGDALYDPQPSRRCHNNLRTRIATANGSYAAAAFCRGGSTPSLFLIWMKSTTLEGRTIAKLATLEQQSATVPFEFVPWGRERKPHLLVLTTSRVPSLLRMTSEGADEVAKGVPIPEGVEVGAPTWCDINKDGLLEIVAPITDEDGALSVLVLLAEAKADKAGEK